MRRTCEQGGARLTSIIQIELRRNERRSPDPDGLLRGPTLLERLRTMTPEEIERQESEYWARIQEKSLDPRK